jgi:hypothetical protein
MPSEDQDWLLKSLLKTPSEDPELKLKLLLKIL